MAESTVMEEVVVTASPIRQSESAAIETKREALNVLDAISADTIGRFPDQNLADSLARVPGVAIERDQGQARYVNLRGAPFRYTAIAINGIDVPGAENGRIPRFDSFPAFITSKLTVNKAITADMPGEAVSGFVDIETNNPFDREGISFALDGGLGEQDLGGGDVDKLALRSSFSNENFGVLAFYSENSRAQITDNREYDLGLEGGQIVANELDFRSYKILRSDEAYGGHVEFRGDDDLWRVYLSNTYSEFTDEEERNQYVAEFLAPTAGLTGDNAPVQLLRALEDGIYENSTNTTTMGLDFTVQGFDVETSYSFIDTEFVQNLPITYQLAGFAGVGASGPIPYLASYDLTNLTDPILTLNGDPDDALFLANFGIGFYNPLEQEVDKFKFDVSRDIANDSVIKFGMQIDQREAEGGANTVAFLPYPDELVPLINNYDTGKPWESNTTNSLGGTYFDNPALDQAWQQYALYPGGSIDADNVVSIDEDINAGYVSYIRSTDWGSYILGMRVEQTDVTNRGVDGFSYSTDFTDWLPNAHINIDLADNLKLRLSASTGVNRPTYNEWRASAAVDVIEEEISGGNPTLEAETSYGFDASIEYYLDNGSLFSAAAFMRNIDNVIYADDSTIDAGAFIDEYAGEQWTYTGFLNGSDGKFSGVELNTVFFADDLIEGVGISANVTFTDSEFKQANGETVGLPGTSDLIYNAAIFYEDYGISARLNYSWRDKWISPIEDPAEFWGEMERLDAQISYTFPSQISGSEVSVYANFNNITDETDVRYAGNGTINQSESYGMHYLIGLRITY
ncbi:MAG: TonB-dependent receptor [Pseudomonadales bacterium]|nr:TonB-dependent receptor [Pseudomonadales bacterium]